jgi:hypothetical protein
MAATTTIVLDNCVHPLTKGRPNRETVIDEAIKVAQACKLMAVVKRIDDRTWRGFSGGNNPARPPWIVDPNCIDGCVYVADTDKASGRVEATLVFPSHDVANDDVANDWVSKIPPSFLDPRSPKYLPMKQHRLNSLVNGLVAIQRALTDWEYYYGENRGKRRIRSESVNFKEKLPELCRTREEIDRELDDRRIRKEPEGDE